MTAVQSYAVAYGWGAGFFALGAVLSVLLFRRRSAAARLPSSAEPVLAH